MNKILMIALLTFSFTLAGCEKDNSSDTVQQAQQESILAEATASVGMPAITNFRERRLLKEIIELRDQDGLVTYTYLYAENSGKLVFLCNSIGYGIPAATQFTNPEKILHPYSGVFMSLPQADPNGLFSPESAEGTWVMCSNGSDLARPMYVEPRIVVSTFKLPTE
jgi:hypothetical protein